MMEESQGLFQLIDLDDKVRGGGGRGKMIIPTDRCQFTGILGGTLGMLSIARPMGGGSFRSSLEGIHAVRFNTTETVFRSSLMRSMHLLQHRGLDTMRSQMRLRIEWRGHPFIG